MSNSAEKFRTVVYGANKAPIGLWQILAQMEKDRLENILPENESGRIKDFTDHQDARITNIIDPNLQVGKNLRPNQRFTRPLVSVVHENSNPNPVAIAAFASNASGNPIRQWAKLHTPFIPGLPDELNPATSNFLRISDIESIPTAETVLGENDTEIAIPTLYAIYAAIKSGRLLGLKRPVVAYVLKDDPADNLAKITNALGMNGETWGEYAQDGPYLQGEITRMTSTAGEIYDRLHDLGVPVSQKIVFRK